jgi:aerobic-type carbon monoxide dehydrogenase small subunit (CoxS/CutS family)
MDKQKRDENKLNLSRRQFIKGSGAGLGLVFSTGLYSACTVKTVPPKSLTVKGKYTSKVILRVNGALYDMEVDNRWTLTQVLREQLGLIGTRSGCNHGGCGTCTVLVDGKPVYSCSHLAVEMEGKDIETIEGLEKEGKLSSLQQAFLDHDARQCGFCTSGQIMSAKGLLNRNSNPSREDVREAIAGNLCRCGTYKNTVDAVLAAAKTKY